MVLSTASLAGLYPQSGSPIYATVKGAIVHMARGMKHLNDQKAEVKVRVIAICPSFSPTGIQQRIDLPLVPSEMVVDAMMHGIEDTSIAGEAIRITPENWIEVLLLEMGRLVPGVTDSISDSILFLARKSQEA